MGCDLFTSKNAADKNNFHSRFSRNGKVRDSLENLLHDSSNEPIQVLINWSKIFILETIEKEIAHRNESARDLKVSSIFNFERSIVLTLRGRNFQANLKK